MADHMTLTSDQLTEEQVRALASRHFVRWKGRCWFVETHESPSEANGRRHRFHIRENAESQCRGAPEI